eukprot:5174522-Amphidinium_carterae.1
MERKSSGETSNEEQGLCSRCPPSTHGIGGGIKPVGGPMGLLSRLVFMERQPKSTWWCNVSSNGFVHHVASAKTTRASSKTATRACARNIAVSAKQRGHSIHYFGKKDECTASTNASLTGRHGLSQSQLDEMCVTETLSDGHVLPAEEKSCEEKKPTKDFCCTATEIPNIQKLQKKTQEKCPTMENM